MVEGMQVFQQQPHKLRLPRQNWVQQDQWKQQQRQQAWQRHLQVMLKASLAVMQERTLLQLQTVVLAQQVETQRLWGQLVILPTGRDTWAHSSNKMVVPHSMQLLAAVAALG